MVNLVNRARVNTPTVGTGSLALGSVFPGYQSFGDAGVADGDTIRYVIVDGASWEIGVGVYSASGPTLTRSVEESSSSGSLVSLSGFANVFVAASAQDFAVREAFTSVTGYKQPGWFLHLAPYVANNASLTANLLALVPFSTAITFEGALGARITYPSGTFRCCVFEDANGVPGRRIYNGSADISGASAAWYYHANTGIFKPGRYWAGVLSVSGTTWLGYGTLPVNTACATALSTTTGNAGLPIYTATGGVVPTTLIGVAPIGNTFAMALAFQLA